MKNRCLPGSFKVKKKNKQKTNQIDFDVCSAQFFFSKTHIAIRYNLLQILSNRISFCICCVHEMFLHCCKLFFVFHLIWWPFSNVSIWLRSVSHFKLHYCQTKMQTFHKPPSHTVSAPGLHCTLEV